MRVLMINVVCGIRSTGRICTDIASALEADGHEVKIAFGREEVPARYRKYAIRIGTDIDTRIHAVKARLTDGCGFGSHRATEDFIKWVEEYNPDVIHLHNLHGYYLNIDVLFNYLKTCGKKIIWTLHDCWAFTGHAAYCEYVECEKWINGCSNCPNIGEYPSSFLDRSQINWKKKRDLMSHIPNMIIVTPSEWLAGLVKKSFLSNYPVNVIHNGIDTSIFKIIDRKNSNAKNAINQKIVLGVAAIWEKRKGMNDLIKLSEILPNEYRIMLVGLTKKQKRKLPATIQGIERTNTVEELVELYNGAYVYVNPTYEDNYPTTNIEAIACGTPVITYNTGGSGESAVLYGRVVEKGDVEGIAQIIEQGLFEKKKLDFDMKNMVCKYIDIIKDVGV